MKKHTVRINIANRRGEQHEVLTDTRLSLPKRLLRLLFGDFCEMLILTPGKTVEGIEIKEVGAEINDEGLFIKAQGNGE